MVVKENERHFLTQNEAIYYILLLTKWTLFVCNPIFPHIWCLIDNTWNSRAKIANRPLDIVFETGFIEFQFNDVILHNESCEVAPNTNGQTPVMQLMHKI